MFSNTGENRPQPNPALAEKPAPATRRRRAAPVRPRVGIHLYLLSVALVAAATLGLFWGVGFYLLVHPPEEMAAGYAERDRGSGAMPRGNDYVPSGATPPDGKPIPGETEMALSATAVPSPAAGPAQGPAALEAAKPEKSAAAPDPVPASSVGEVPATTTGAASTGDDVLALPSTASELTVGPPQPTEAVPVPAPPGATGKEMGQTAPLAEAADALERTAPDEEPLGSLRAVGHVTAQDANPQAVKSELPNDTSAYPPRNTAEPEESARIAPGSPEQQATAPPKPTSSKPKSPVVIQGVVTDVPNATTWVVLDQTVHLWGIDPGPPNLLAPLVNWVRAKGPVECLPRAKTGRYQCFTAAGEDIAEAALLGGVARAGDRATATYRNAEAQARRKGKGLWGER